jgi:tRNA modification GTPase
MDHQDTIAAVATPPGVGGIGVIRISGSRAEAIVLQLFRPHGQPKAMESHHMYHGDIISIQSKAILDEVLLCLMRAPHSYTGEDVSEIHCHGGPFLIEAILREVIQAGARIAEPGEFTKRAFLNGRMDLSQAEAVCDIIHARSQKAAILAISQLKGSLMQMVEKWQDILIDQLAVLETSIEFSEEMIRPELTEISSDTILSLLEEIRSVHATYREGRIYRHGANIIIAGRPNVGKSSLLNRLLGEQRAIVTPIPGTTRDFIDETMNIKGVPIRLTDTAGIGPTDNIIESEGIRRVWEKVTDADVVIVLVDGAEPMTFGDDDILAKINPDHLIVAINKCDLPAAFTDDAIASRIAGMKPLRISAKFGQGIDNLKEAIYDKMINDRSYKGGEVIITNLRHCMALEKTIEAIQPALSGLKNNISPELIAYELEEARNCLGELSGQKTNKDTLNRIFSNFCIGK